MFGLAAEPPGCLTTNCGEGCPRGMTSMKPVPCNSGGQPRSRCCPGTFPDVLLLVDRGAAAGCSIYINNELGLDTTLLDTSWTTAKELQLLPGGIWQQRRDYDEQNMSKSKTLAGFLSRGLARWVLATLSSLQSGPEGPTLFVAGY